MVFLMRVSRSSSKTGRAILTTQIFGKSLKTKTVRQNSGRRKCYEVSKLRRSNSTYLTSRAMFLRI